MSDDTESSPVVTAAPEGRAAARRLQLRKSGETKINFYNTGLVLISFFSILQYWVTRGFDRAPVQCIRFVLTLLLCRWIHSGSLTAKWVTIVLTWPAGAIWALATPAAWKDDRINGICFGFNALICLFYARALIWSEEIDQYFYWRRDEAARKLVQTLK